MPITDWAGAVVGLHVFFTRWFAGDVPNDDEAFAPLVDALAPSFSIVSPRGDEMDRDGTLQALRGAYASGVGGPTISIADVRVLHEAPPFATVRYVEIQDWVDGRHTERVSTALLEAAADIPDGVRWHRVHETWLPGQGSVESRS